MDGKPRCLGINHRGIFQFDMAERTKANKVNSSIILSFYYIELKIFASISKQVDKSYYDAFYAR